MVEITLYIIPGVHYMRVLNSNQDVVTIVSKFSNFKAEINDSISSPNLY